MCVRYQHNCVRSFVDFCLRSLLLLERCGLYHWTLVCCWHCRDEPTLSAVSYLMARVLWRTKIDLHLSNDLDHLLYDPQPLYPIRLPSDPPGSHSIIAKGLDLILKHHLCYLISDLNCCPTLTKSIR